MNFDNFDFAKIIELSADYGIKTIGAIAIWIIGNWLIKKVLKLVKTIMETKNYELTFRNFILGFIGWTLKIFLIITLLGTIGFSTASLAALLAALGLAIGMALQGSLGNFAGGILILIFKPFKAGDLIEAQGELGHVKDIEIFTTKIIGLTHREIIIPNGALTNGNIINYTSMGTRRVDLVIGVSYDADIKQTKDVLLKAVTSNPKVLTDPPPTINVLTLNEYSVDFAVRPFCKTEDYWDVHFGCTEQIKIDLDLAKIEIPYPHSVEIKK